MIAFFKEIFEYHHQLNQKLIDELIKHHDVLPERTIPLFCHLLNAHQIWNSRVLNFQSPGTWDVFPIGASKEMDLKNYNDTITILDTLDLAKVIDYKTMKGQPFSNTLRDILFHANNHTTHHRAQIISDFRQAGITPLTTDYIFYKR